MCSLISKVTTFCKKATRLRVLRDAYTIFVGWPLLLHMTVIIPLVWLAGSIRFNFLFMLVVPLWYLAHVHNVQKARLESQIQAKLEQSLLRNLESTGVETVTWLNALIQESWPSWLELYVSKNLSRLLEYGLAEHKPKVVSKLAVEYFRLGCSPPVVRSAKVYRLTTDDKDATLEIDVAFCAAEDMRIELLSCLNKGTSMGLALEGKMYVDNLRIEGKLRLGFKFVGYYPYVGQLSVGFVTTPALGLSLRPLSSCSVDISDLPGVATWLAKSLTTAVEAFLVEPYSYVLDLLAKWGTDFGLSNDPVESNVGGRNEVGFAVLEILEGRNLEAAGRTVFCDPYVKIKLDKFKFKTTVKKQTSNPSWHELFKIPFLDGSVPEKIFLQVKDHDTFRRDNAIGICEINLKELQGGNRHDMWITLQDVKTGELHVAVTIVEPDLANSKEKSTPATTVNPEVREFRRKFGQGKAQMGRYSRKHFSWSPFSSQTSSVISITEDPTLITCQDNLGEKLPSMRISRTLSDSKILSEKENLSPMTIKRRLDAEAVAIIQGRDSPVEVKQVSVPSPKDACSDIDGKREIVPPDIPAENVPKKPNWKKRFLRALHLKPHPNLLCCVIERRHSETL